MGEDNLGIYVKFTFSTVTKFYDKIKHNKIKQKLTCWSWEKAKQKAESPREDTRNRDPLIHTLRNPIKNSKLEDIIYTKG